MESYQFLKAFRELAGLTQKEVASDIISESYYSKVERGIHQLDAENFFKIITKNYLSLNILETLTDGIFDSQYMNNIQNNMVIKNLPELYKKVKEGKIKLSTSHYLSLIIYIYIS